MEIKLSKYTAEDYDAYKKLQDEIEEEGKKVLFESIFYPPELRDTYYRPYIENIYDRFEDFYKEISYRALDTITYNYLKDSSPLITKEMFKEQLKGFYEMERAEWIRKLVCKAMYFDRSIDLIYNNLSDEDKACLEELLPDEIFTEKAELKIKDKPKKVNI